MLKAALLMLLLTSHAYAWLYHIAWDYDTAATFRVYRADDGGLPSRIDEVTTALFLDDTISEGASYRYFVTAVVDGNESAPSDGLDVATGWRGDIDGDGSVTGPDMLMLCRHLAGNTDAANRCGDLDDNFALNAVDAALLLRRLAW